MESIPPSLPASLRASLETFVASARAAFGGELRSVVLFGSAAEGAVRPLSDVNVLLLLAAFDRGKAEKLREPMRLAHAAIRLNAMFLLESELPAATEAFAVKFGDIARRRSVLFGPDPFANTAIPRSAAVTRLRQTLLNLTLRMREAYITRGLREEQLIAAISDHAGPLRACAATLLELQGLEVPPPKEALARVAATLLGAEAGASLMQQITTARTDRALGPGAASAVFSALIDLTERMSAAARAL